MLFCSFDETFHALLSCFFRSRYVLRSFLFLNILSRNIILERILRTLAVRFQAPRLETIQVSDAIVGRTEKLESSIFACLCIAPFSWFLCRSLAEHVESCHGWIIISKHHSVSVGLPSVVIVNKETIQNSQLVPYNAIVNMYTYRIMIWRGCYLGDPSAFRKRDGSLTMSSTNSF